MKLILMSIFFRKKIDNNNSVSGSPNHGSRFTVMLSLHSLSSTMFFFVCLIIVRAVAVPATRSLTVVDNAMSGFDQLGGFNTFHRFLDRG